jgi:ribosomal protein L37AE/L43A
MENCEVCKKPMQYPGYTGIAHCPHCGMGYEYEEGAQLILDDELRGALKEVLLARKTKLESHTPNAKSERLRASRL